MSQAKTFDPNLAKLHAIEADIAAGKLQQAATSLNALNAATPADPRIYLAAAMLARAANNPKQEIASLQHAVAISPSWPPGHLELAKVYSRLARHDDAVATANRAVELVPKDLTVLEVAVAVAHAAGDTLTGRRHLQAAFALKPTDTRITKALGICLIALGDYRDAEAHWRNALVQDPDDWFVLGWLGACLIGLDRKEEAVEVLQRAIALSPGNPTLTFYLAVARGETPLTQPREMTQDLFDGYANRFDKHLVGELKYRVPKRVAEMIRDGSSGLHTSVLDLGCGTGLLGVYLGPISGAFVGVDVSAKMLEKAVPHGVYTELRQADLLDELRRISPESFEYIAANDVFIYVGDLSEIIPAAFHVLRHGGAMIFSCETADSAEGALVLRSSKRYAHSRESIEILCRDAGFSSCSFEMIDLRFDGGDVPIAGFIAVAHKA
ncbi:tetratricopeptide repeat protein [Pseudolysobacter antarcticus]|uniref:Tetratricopeptide repeat protein n=1 Tax=Pseudolysobacter antarcticus TaxID=2511995 RepID=A0A411HL37_9GAMM|nr:tetratricopeptide repeat protein [Pseudolysobacter antarcticus]QBB71252.1 tetratricopeptide repeat protein [Pseudolysobacter antarcticus]